MYASAGVAARSSPALQLQQQCRWFAGSGTCRRPASKCSLRHVRQPQAAASGVSYEERCWSLSSAEDDEEQQQEGTTQQQQQRGVGGGARRAWRFSVATFNVLSDKYARHYRSYLYNAVPSGFLDWRHRRAAIVAELAALAPDVICLQEVDRFEDLEVELAALGYSGLYLQRDGGRRDGCATFWRRSLLRPALVREVRYSQHDLKDNVALLVLFEPRTLGVLGAAAAAAAASEAAAAAQDQQQQQQPSNGGNAASPQQAADQQQRSGMGVQQLLSAWMPRGWLWSSSASSSAMAHSRASSQLLLRPVHSSHFPAAAADSRRQQPQQHGCLYQVPVELEQPPLLPTQPPPARQSSWGHAGDSAAGAAGGSGATALGTSPVLPRSSSLGSSSSSKRSSEEHRRNSSSSRRRHVRDAAAAAALQQGTAGSAPLDQQQQQSEVPLPEWLCSAVLVANTHIMFTPEKGDVKLGQARLLLEEADRMARWYLEQQQLLEEGVAAAAAGRPGGGSSSSSNQAGGSSGQPGALLASGMQAVATILTGDFNATPNSALYAFLASGELDLQTVSRRNVSSSSGSSHPARKGFRGFQRAASQRRHSAELEQQQQQQAAAGSPPPGSAGQQVPPPGAATPPAAAAAPDLATPGSSSSSSSIKAAGAATGSDDAADDDAAAAAASSPGVLGSSPPSRQHRWSDREVRRAAGMSYDELVEDSLAHLEARQAAAAAPGSSGSTPQPQQQQQQQQQHVAAASQSAQIARAAAAFGEQVAGGAGAAAAATAAASAAAVQTDRLAPPPPLAPRPPLLLRHGLDLKSSYFTVLGREPDYTSSHSQFMDTCDFIWFAETPVTHGSGDVSSGTSSSSGSTSSWEDAGEQQQQQPRPAGATTPGSSLDGRHQEQPQYQLRPVAVLLPPDGTLLPKGLPTKHFGSDHICLCADFELRALGGAGSAPAE